MLRNWQLVAAAVWGLLALLALFRGVLFDEAVLDRLPVRNWAVATLICGFLSLWNFARWYQWRSARRDAVDPAAQPLRPNREAGGGYEYNPEFDFQKPDAERNRNGGK